MSDESLEYPWHIRPAHIPLERKEIELALSIAKFDKAEAARILRVPIDRLEGVLISQSYSHLNNKIRESLYERLVTVQGSGKHKIVTLHRPDYDCNIEITRHADRIELVICPVSQAMTESLRVAKQIARDNKDET
jgi:hypothetical protein